MLQDSALAFTNFSSLQIVKVSFLFSPGAATGSGASFGASFGAASVSVFSLSFLLFFFDKLLSFLLIV